MAPGLVCVPKLPSNSPVRRYHHPLPSHLVDASWAAKGALRLDILCVYIILQYIYMYMYIIHDHVITYNRTVSMYKMVSICMELYAHILTLWCGACFSSAVGHLVVLFAPSSGYRPRAQSASGLHRSWVFCHNISSSSIWCDKMTHVTKVDLNRSNWIVQVRSTVFFLKWIFHILKLRDTTNFNTH